MEMHGKIMSRHEFVGVQERCQEICACRRQPIAPGTVLGATTCASCQQ